MKQGHLFGKEQGTGIAKSVRVDQGMYIYSAEMFFEGRVKSGASVNCSEVIGKGVPERNC